MATNSGGGEGDTIGQSGAVSMWVDSQPANQEKVREIVTCLLLPPIPRFFLMYLINKDETEHTGQVRVCYWKDNGQGHGEF